MKKIVFGNGREIELPEDVEIIDEDETVTSADFADIAAIIKEQHKHEVKDEEGMTWR